MLISRRPRMLSFTLWFIAIVQLVLGAGFLIAPDGMDDSATGVDDTAEVQHGVDGRR